MSGPVRASFVRLIVAACAFLLDQESFAATITVNGTDAYGRTFIDVAGEIVVGDDQTFQQKVAVVHAGVDKVIVTLSGPGGAAIPALNIGELIHKNGWSTYVPSGTMCASSCGIIWLAGTPRAVEGAPGVVIGFHAVYSSETKGESGVGNAVLGSHLSRWGLSDVAVECVTIFRPNEMGWLSGPDGNACGITWQVLTPARDVPLWLWLPAPPQTEPKLSKLQQELILDCTPTSRSSEPDPVVSIAIKVMWEPSEGRIQYFDAWHRTAKGNTFKRSEQYGDRRFYAQETKWMWDGRWIRGSDIYMIGHLAVANGAYAYNERVYHGKPGPQNLGEEATSSACKEVKQFPEREASPAPPTATPGAAYSQPQSQPDKRQQCRRKASGAQFFCALAGYGPAYCLEYRVRAQQVCEEEQ